MSNSSAVYEGAIQVRQPRLPAHPSSTVKGRGGAPGGGGTSPYVAAREMVKSAVRIAWGPGLSGSIRRASRGPRVLMAHSESGRRGGGNRSGIRCCTMWPARTLCIRSRSRTSRRASAGAPVRNLPAHVIDGSTKVAGPGTAARCRLQCDDPGLAGVTGSVCGRTVRAAPPAECAEETGELWQDGMRPT